MGIYGLSISTKVDDFEHEQPVCATLHNT